jgi:hypothetical protein
MSVPGSTANTTFDFSMILNDSFMNDACS